MNPVFVTDQRMRKCGRFTGETALLFSASLQDMVRMAGSAGLPPSCICRDAGEHFPHYHLTANKRLKVLELGAREAGPKFLEAFIRSVRSRALRGSY